MNAHQPFGHIVIEPKRTSLSSWWTTCASREGFTARCIAEAEERMRGSLGERLVSSVESGWGGCLRATDGQWQVGIGAEG